MAESERHEQMKRVAKAVLESEGYQAQMEKRLDSARADVFAESIDETVIVELGDLGNERARYLHSECDRLVHVPYENIEPSGGEEKPKTRTNINIHANDWEEFGNLVGNRKRSETLRDMMKVYIEVFGSQ